VQTGRAGISSLLYIWLLLAQFDRVMTRFAICSFLATLFGLASGEPVLAAATSNPAPAFSEVYELIKAHGAGVTDAELNRTSIEGLIAALAPRVTWVTNNSSATPAAEVLSLTQTSLFDGPVAYFRIGRVNGSLARELRSSYEHLASTNSLAGVVLDLRYAPGDDYAAAAAAADLFTSKAEPLLNWGSGVVSSHEKTNAIRLPVIVLVNHDTAGAAEALAALMREHDAGLILGSQTAGRAMVMQEFPLSTGGRLRIAVAPVTLGDGSALAAQGIFPDITVVVDPEDERAYYANPYTVLARANSPAVARLSSTNSSGRTNLVSRRIRLNEAELVREHREGLDRDPDAEVGTKASETPKALVNDPTLVRALDLLKGLALVRQGRS
jgi:hypothetical protein